MTLLLGPPGCGKTTLLKALAGKSDQSLKVIISVIYSAIFFPLSDYMKVRKWTEVNKSLVVLCLWNFTVEIFRCRVKYRTMGTSWMSLCRRRHQHTLASTISTSLRWLWGRRSIFLLVVKVSGNGQVLFVRPPGFYHIVSSYRQMPSGGILLRLCFALKM